MRCTYPPLGPVFRFRPFLVSAFFLTAVASVTKVSHVTAQCSSGSTCKYSCNKDDEMPAGKWEILFEDKKASWDHKICFQGDTNKEGDCFDYRKNKKIAMEAKGCWRVY